MHETTKIGTCSGGKFYTNRLLDASHSYICFWYLYRLLKCHNTCKHTRVIIISDIQAHLLNSEIRQVVPCNLKMHVFLVIFTVLPLLTLVVYD